MADHEPLLLVVRVSDSFADFWPLLAREQVIAVREWTPQPGEALPTGPAALRIVAAGGLEHDLPGLLSAYARGDGVPVIAVGAVPSHRVAARAGPVRARASS